MATTVTPIEQSQAASRPAPRRSDRRYRITIDRYNRMVEAGVFHAKDPVFLWKGDLVEKMNKNPPHSIALMATDAMLSQTVPAGWHVRPEQPLELSNDSSPEPDLVVARGGLRDYTRRHPTARDVALVVEVSDSSLAEDRGEVLEAYAAEGIPVYWIVNIPMGRVEVYTDPTGPAERPTYRTSHIYLPDDEVTVVIDGREVGRIAARDLLP